MLPGAVIDIASLVGETRAALRASQERLHEDYRRSNSATALLRGRARAVDHALRKLWRALAMPAELALVAVGGYGRRELYPASDVDLLFLVPEGFTGQARLEPLIGLLWDIGLDVGHSVRSVAECLAQGGQDITIQTSLLEARLLCGNRHLFAEFDRHVRGSIDPESFLQAKQLEQAERYARFNDTPFALEPNCKESPGGLRDLQVVIWVARAAGLGSTWRELAARGLVTPFEANQLARHEGTLKLIRARLHVVAGRREDRLVFDLQTAVAGWRSSLRQPWPVTLAA